MQSVFYSVVVGRPKLINESEICVAEKSINSLKICKINSRRLKKPNPFRFLRLFSAKYYGETALKPQ